MSQAAILIALRFRLWPYASESMQDIAASNRRVAFSDILSGEETVALRIPEVDELKERSRELRHGTILRQYSRRTGQAFGFRSIDPNHPVLERIAELVNALDKERNSLDAGALVLACLEHPHFLVRVAAAAAYGQLCADLSFVGAILEEGIQDANLLVKALAATALAQFDPEHPALQVLKHPASSPFGGPRRRTSMLVHGTFARTETWWQPRPEFNFHAYIKFEVLPDLYSAEDRFEWTGGYSDPDREDAAQRLAAWAVQRQEQGMVLLGHSHGANVMLRATHYGLKSEKMVLLSCPVHLPKYEPLWANVNDVVSVRVKADLVIMLDGGGQRFRHPRIRENVLSLWFNHSATHEPDVWRSHGVPSMI